MLPLYCTSTSGKDGLELWVYDIISDFVGFDTVFDRFALV